MSNVNYLHVNGAGVGANKASEDARIQFTHVPPGLQMKDGQEPPSVAQVAMSLKVFRRLHAVMGAMIDKIDSNGEDDVALRINAPTPSGPAS